MESLGNLTGDTLLQTAKMQADMEKIARAGAKVASTASLTDNSEASAKAASAAEDFEAVFLSEMLKPVFESVDVDETFGGGKGEEVFRGMMVQQFGKMIAARGGIGLADSVKEQLIKMQSTQSTQTTDLTV